MTNKIILLSQVPLPYSRIGSWPKLFDYYFANNKSIKITDIICPYDSNGLSYSNIKYHRIKVNFFEKIKSKITGKRHQKHVNQAFKITQNSTSTITILIIDNYGLLFELNDFFTQKGIRKDVYIIFFSHGYSYFFDSYRAEFFFNSMDHMVFLSEKSYSYELSRVHSISAKVSILPNGIDLKEFQKIDLRTKKTLKRNLNLDNKTIFLWCANERPKKGLNILLAAWAASSLYNNDFFELLIVGTSANYTYGNIKFLGKIPNNELPKLYQLSDYYLFTTLCHEGFPLSLSEAIACGTKCIVSQIDPLPDIFSRFGNISFVHNPNIVSSWVENLEMAVLGQIKFENQNRELINTELSIETWCKKLNHIIENQNKIFQFKT